VRVMLQMFIQELDSLYLTWVTGYPERDFVLLLHLFINPVKSSGNYMHQLI
jgi:hypothetical protein